MPWLPAALPAASEPPDIRLARDGHWWRLPADYEILGRSIPRGPARNVQAGDALPHAAPPPASSDLPEDEVHLPRDVAHVLRGEIQGMDLDDWDTPEDDEGPPSWNDFDDDGETDDWVTPDEGEATPSWSEISDDDDPDDPDWYERAVRD